MSHISLTPLDLSLAAILVLALALLSFNMRLHISRVLLIAATRTVVQLLLIGLVLKALFTHVHLAWVGLMASIMLLIAAYEIVARQKYRLRGPWSFGLGAGAMFISSFSITVLALLVIINAQPWYTPQYAIPLLGMMLGNTMSGIALAMDRLLQSAWERRAVIEAKLMLGQRWRQAIIDIRRDSVRSGLIPIINAMAAAGIVSLPGMMTGQILAGADPLEAVKYQILIMFMIAAATGFGTMAAVWFASRRLFDERHRLRLERLRHEGDS